MRRPAALAVLLAVPLSLAAALALGSVELGATRLSAALFGGGDEVAREIVWGLRAPRAFAAFACGGLLAVAGALLQILLRNPLADPGILGISGGAAVGALAAILAGAGGAGEHAAAFAGAMGAAGLVMLVAARLGTLDVTRVLLAGVALAAIFGAVVSVMLALAPAMQLRGMLFWLLGDLSAAGSPAAAWLVLAAVVIAATALGSRLDALALGRDKAQSLGVHVAAVQATAFVAAAGATVAAVMLAGAIGFVGLVVPHALRLAGWHAHTALVPLAAAAGGSLVVVADTIGRTAVPPLELPVGAILALVGAPVLLVLLARMR
ncbi:MAG: iron ABC transporter permease [Burkholderiales bacterium]|nr:iron ABC transporter permease [Burkholderiales bacterium]